jgi:hypothetical protein
MAAGLAAASTSGVARSDTPARLSRFARDFASRRVTVQVMGDSIMNADTVPMNQRWHQMLGQSFQSEGVDTSMWIGGAINGSKAVDYAPGGKYSAHTEFCVNNPSLILMDWRINDWWGFTTPSRYQEDFRGVINRVRQLSPTSSILLLNTPWVYNSDLLATHPTPQWDYSAKLDQLGTEFNIPVLHLEWFFPGDDPCGFYVLDKVHHSRAGQYVIYTALRSYLLSAVSV